MKLYGGIEAGGTKFVCAVGSSPDDIRAEIRIPTTSPAETIQRAIQFFREQPEPVAAVGIGSFGPVDPDPASPTYGRITSTPKAGWRDTPVRDMVADALGIPVAFDTDVNAAALGEHCWGAAQDVDSFIYLTVGTGIGGGCMVEGKLLHGLIHPEMGHVPIPREPHDRFPGACPFHRGCLEGMASGPALKARWGVPPEMIPADHPAWLLEAHYLAQALVSYICTLSPKRIILGGGVMQQAHLFPLIRQEVQQLLNGYVQSPAILEQIDQYIVPPGLGNRAGVLGAITLAQQAPGS